MRPLRSPNTSVELQKEIDGAFQHRIDLHSIFGYSVVSPWIIIVNKSYEAKQSKRCCYERRG
jgi:hypothetical protein